MPPLTPGEERFPIAALRHERERSGGREVPLRGGREPAASSRPSGPWPPRRRPGGMATVPTEVREEP